MNTSRFRSSSWLAMFFLSALVSLSAQVPGGIAVDASAPATVGVHVTASPAEPEAIDEKESPTGPIQAETPASPQSLMPPDLPPGLEALPRTGPGSAEAPGLPIGSFPSAGVASEVRPEATLASSSAHHVLQTVSSLLPSGLLLGRGLLFPEEDGTGFGPLPASGPTLRLSLPEAVARALIRQPDLEVKRLEVDRRRQDIDLERAAFDPAWTGAVSMADLVGKQITQARALDPSITNRAEGQAAWTRTSPAGTRTAIALEMTRNRSARLPNLFETRVGLDVTHPLRRGAGRTVNLVAVRQAELDVQVAQEEVEGFVLALLADVEHSYWQVLLARQELAIVQASARLARQQHDETARRIALGSLPESELAAAAAEVALREEAVINAGSAAETARIALLRLLNTEVDRFWEARIQLADLPELPEFEIRDVEPHLRHALETRPELRRARLLLEQDRLELVHTRNGLLPQLDFFLSLGKSGYADAFHGTAREFGRRAYDLEAGLRYELFPGRREARARDRQARFTTQQREEAVRNLQFVIQEEVLTSTLEVQRALQQVKATSQTVERQKEKRRTEEIKFQVGKTTAFQVAQAQRDEAASEIAALKARIGVLNALTDLYRADGSLAIRRGVVMALGPVANLPAPPREAAVASAGPSLR